MSQSFLDDRTYNTLKFVAQILLPAIGTLYFAIAGLWGLPNATEIVGTIVALDTFLGVLLGLSTQKYKKKRPNVGEIVVTEDHELGRKTFSLDLRNDPDTLDENAEVLFRIKKGEIGAP